jgi:hypothetical protein
MCFAILCGVVTLLFPRKATLSSLIWIWIAIFGVQLLDYVIAAVLLRVEPMALAGSFGSSCALGLCAFFCLRKLGRERQMPIGSQAHKAGEDVQFSDRMLHDAIKLESRNRYDEALALYRRIIAEYPSSKAAPEAESCIRSIEKARNQ